MSCLELAEQFRQYDNDDGRSSRDYQNVNDEQCFNQLCDEFCSECKLIISFLTKTELQRCSFSSVNMQSSDEDALLNEQLLKILQNNRNPFNEKDLPLLESQLR